MITFLRGLLVSKQPDLAILDVNGVGYRIFIPLSTYEVLPAVGETALVLTTTYVREEVFHLYGFATPEEREMFLILTTVTGIGVKLGLAALSALSPSSLAAAIVQGDIRTLSRISGVGQRTAQRLALELKEKVGDFAPPPPTAPPLATLTTSMPAPPPLTMKEELASALINLGYKRPQVDQVVRQALSEGSTNDLGQALRAALKILAT